MLSEKTHGWPERTADSAAAVIRSRKRVAADWFAAASWARGEFFISYL